MTPAAWGLGRRGLGQWTRGGRFSGRARGAAARVLIGRQRREFGHGACGVRASEDAQRLFPRRGRDPARRPCRGGGEGRHARGGGRRHQQPVRRHGVLPGGGRGGGAADHRLPAFGPVRLGQPRAGGPAAAALRALRPAGPERDRLHEPDGPGFRGLPRIRSDVLDASAARGHGGPSGRAHRAHRRGDRWDGCWPTATPPADAPGLRR